MNSKSQLRRDRAVRLQEFVGALAAAQYGDPEAMADAVKRITPTVHFHAGHLLGFGTPAANEAAEYVVKLLPEMIGDIPIDSQPLPMRYFSMRICGRLHRFIRKQRQPAVAG